MSTTTATRLALLPPLALLLLAGLALPARAAEVMGLLPATGANVDPGTLEAARDVLRGHLEKTGREVRLCPADATREATPAEAAAAAQAVGASRAAVLRLSQLGSVLRVRLAVYEVPGGRLLHADDMAGATSADIDPALQRLAQGYAAGAPAAAVAHIDTVTDKEARAQNRITATRSFGVRLGAITPLNPGGQGTGAGGGIFWQYDARRFLVDVSIDLFSGDHYHDTAVGFGAYLPLTDADFAPYLGGGLKYASTAFLSSWNAGLQPYLAGGVIFGRISTVQIRGEVNYFHDLFTNLHQQRNGLLWTAAVVY
jgi:hypothetical protein